MLEVKVHFLDVSAHSDKIKVNLWKYLFGEEFSEKSMTSHVATVFIEHANSIEHAISQASMLCTNISGNWTSNQHPQLELLTDSEQRSSMVGDIFTVCGVDYMMGMSKVFQIPKNNPYHEGKLDKGMSISLDSLVYKGSNTTETSTVAMFNIVNMPTFRYSDDSPIPEKCNILMRVAIEQDPRGGRIDIPISYFYKGKLLPKIGCSPSVDMDEVRDWDIKLNDDASISVNFYDDSHKLVYSYYINIQDECIFYESHGFTDGKFDEDKLEDNGWDDYAEDFSSAIFPELLTA